MMTGQDEHHIFTKRARGGSMTPPPQIEPRNALERVRINA
jgi:hypothetical protein